MCEGERLPEGDGGSADGRDRAEVVAGGEVRRVGGGGGGDGEFVAGLPAGGGGGQREGGVARGQRGGGAHPGRPGGAVQPEVAGAGDPEAGVGGEDGRAVPLEPALVHGGEAQRVDGVAGGGERERAPDLDVAGRAEGERAAGGEDERAALLHQQGADGGVGVEQHVVGDPYVAPRAGHGAAPAGRVGPAAAALVQGGWRARCGAGRAGVVVTGAQARGRSGVFGGLWVDMTRFAGFVQGAPEQLLAADGRHHGGHREGTEQHSSCYTPTCPELRLFTGLSGCTRLRRRAVGPGGGLLALRLRTPDGHGSVPSHPAAALGTAPLKDRQISSTARVLPEISDFRSRRHRSHGGHEACVTSITDVCSLNLSLLNVLPVRGHTDPVHPQRRGLPSDALAARTTHHGRRGGPR